VAQQGEFDQMLSIAKNEIERDAPRIAKNLDLSADATQLSQNDMVGQVQRNWSNPQYRQQLVQAQSPESVVDLYLKASGITNQDGTPMTVSQYQKQVLEPWLQLGGEAVHNATPAPGALAPHPALQAAGAPSTAAPTPALNPSAAAPDTAPETQPSPIGAA
jgi:hypothetical protein